jgi:excisionase family DNA binding protein
MTSDGLSILVHEITRAVAQEVVEQALDRALSKIVGEVRRVIDEEARNAAGGIYVRVQAAAEMMSAHPSTVRKLVAAGKLGRYSVEGQLRIKASEVHAYLVPEAGARLPPIDLNQRAFAILTGTKATNNT